MASTQAAAAAGAEAKAVDALAIAQGRLAAATAGAGAAQQRLALAQVGGGAAGAASGLAAAGGAANALRGGLIGLSRVTPVTVFGLGLAGTAGIAAGLAFTKAIGAAADFEHQLNVLNAVAQPTVNELERMSDLAKELGADVRLPAVSAGDAAAAMTELAKAGLEVEDAMGGARGVLQLATAAQIDNASAARIAASALNAFALEGPEAVRVADLLAASSIAAQGEITDMAAALQQAAAVANNANISIEDTVTAISLLARNGLLGSDAGTSLRTTILRLVPTTKEARQFVEALGISFEDAQGNLLPLPQLFEQYRLALADLTETQQQAVLQQIFGQDAIRAAAILSREGAAGFNEMAREVNRSGVAQDLANAQTEGFRGAVSGLNSNLETLGATLGAVVLPGLTAFATVLSGAVGGVNAAVEATKNLFDVFGGEGGDVVESENTRLIARELDAISEKINEVGGFQAEKVTGGLRDSMKELADSFVEVAVAQERFELEDFGPETQDILRNLGGLGDRILNALGAAKFDAEKGSRGIADGIRNGIPDTEAALNQFRTTLVRRAASLGQQLSEGLDEQLFGVGLQKLISTARAAGFKIGDALVSAVARGATAAQREAVASAREAVQEAREAAEEQVTAAVKSARENFESLSDSLNAQLGELIDVGPIGQRLQELRRELEELQDSVSRRQLNFNLSEAQIELRDMKASVAGLGEQTPEQKRALGEFLAPLRNEVANAKSEIKEFDLTQTIEQQEDLLEAAKKAAEEGLAKLTAQFQSGRISASEFESLLSSQLNPALDTLRSKSGRNLGLGFSQEFLQNVKNLVEQAKALSGFLDRPGTAPGSDVVRPGEAVSEGQKQVQDALDNYNAARADLQAETNRILREVRDLLRGGKAPPGGKKPPAGFNAGGPQFGPNPPGGNP